MFGIIFYGSPYLAEPEGIIVIFVTKYCQIIDLLVECSNFDNKLKGN